AWRLAPPLPACGERSARSCAPGEGAPNLCSFAVLAMRRYGGALLHLQCRCDRLQHSVHVEQNLIVPEPQHAVAMVRKPPVTDSIAFILAVLSAVHLDDETALAADEIDEIWPDRFLTHELASVDGT